MIQESTCPSCGRRILREDDKLRISHEAPECKGFKALLARFTGARSTEVLELEGGELVAPKAKG